MYNKSYAKISTLRPQFQKETGGKKKEKSIMVSSSKKGNYTRAFHAYFFRNTVQDGAGIPSILTIPPPPRDKILYNPRYFLDRFRDFVSESKRLPLRVFMKQWRKRACTRIHMFEVCSLRNERGEMVWEMVELCDILQGPILSPSAPTHVCPRHWKSFLSIDGKNCFDYETTGFSLFLFLFFLLFFFCFLLPYEDDDVSRWY